MAKALAFLWRSAAILAAGSGFALAQEENLQSDVQAILRNFNTVLSSNSDGQPTNWTNPETRNYGQIMPRTSYTSADGQSCRSYISIWVHGGGEDTQTGNACRGGDGVWHTQPGGRTSRGAITLASAQPRPAPNQNGTNNPPELRSSEQAGVQQPAPRPAQQQAQAPTQQGQTNLASANPPPRNTSPPASNSPQTPATNTAPRPAALRMTLSRDEAIALERNMSRLGLAVGPIDGTFDQKSQDAARMFWQDQMQSGDPTVDQAFLTLVQVTLSADQSRGGVLPVIITGAQAIGQTPEISRYP